MASKNLILNYKNKFGFSDKFIAKTGKHLLPYIQKLKKILKEKDNQRPESFLNLVESQILIEIKRLAYQKIKEAKILILIGIGGSSLGTQAIYETLRGEFNFGKEKKFPQTIFLDKSNVAYLNDVLNFLKQQTKSNREILIVLISKSGTTLESLINFNVLWQFLKRRGTNFKNNVVVITERNSLLWQTAEKENFTLLEIPKAVSGRYSVFSSVGLFPLAALKINIQKLIEGAKTMRNKCLEENVKDNPALILAAFLFWSQQKGKTIIDNFFFEPNLEILGKWLRQLLAESLGKNGRGLTPTVSLGTAYLHSVFQLSLAGPRNKSTIFVFVAQPPRHRLSIKPLPEFKKLISSFQGKDVFEIIEAVYQSVKNVYAKKKLPFIEIILPEISEDSLGQFLMLQMMATIFLAKLWKINAFNQPAVELYKSLARKILAGKVKKFNND